MRQQGFGYDFISDRQLLAGQGAAYKAIVVPRTTHMPLDTLKELLQRAANGQPVFFVDALPTDVSGYRDHAQRRAELKRMLAGHESRVVEAGALSRALAGTAVRREPMADLGMEYIRRKHETGHHYFIANLTASPVDQWVTLGVPFASAVIMDPRSAETGVARMRNKQVYLQLEPGETRIIRTFDERMAGGQPWPVLGTAGDPLPVRGNWKVSFVDGGPVLPADTTMTELKSWTGTGDAEATRFAGTARYSIQMEIPRMAGEWRIDLGDVRESARVFINGEEAAGLFGVPFRALVGRHLKPGNNLLEIEVTNLSANRIRDMDVRKVPWKNYHDSNIMDQNYKPFDASRWPLAPSGLLGPVTLTPMKALPMTMRNEDAKSQAAPEPE
jgi:hypothetical protein